MPRVDHNLHQRFESWVIDQLSDLGFRVSSATYHEVQNANVQEELQRNYSPTALYVRLRSDRVALRDDITFELEVKTNEGPHHNMALETLQLLHHVVKVPLGVDCLYAYYDRSMCKEEARAFWVSDLPKIARCFIPTNTRYDKEAIKIIETSLWMLGFSGQPIRKPIGGEGSKDPFVLIDSSDVVSMNLLSSVFESLSVEGKKLQDKG